MTQRLALGITVGASNSVAVAAAGESDDGTDPVGGGTVRTHPSVLRLSLDATPTFGTRAHGTGRHSSEVLVEGFLARVGDPVDMLAEDGSAHSAADLVAATIECLIDESTSDTGRSVPPIIVACHPAWWSRHTVDIQRAALEHAGLGEVTLVPEPTAAARWFDGTHGPFGAGAVVVYDLGASGSTVSVVRTGDHAGLLGAPLRSTDIAGAEFDLLTMRYVLANAILANDFDPFDPTVERDLAALREHCRKAKEDLSINTATVVPVRLDPTDPHGGTVRLVRDELEDLLRGPLLNAVDSIREAVHRAGLDIGDISRVLLTGGGGAIPLVAEMISAEFGLPVLAAAEPGHTAARGAALLATDLRTADLRISDADHVPLATPTAAIGTSPPPYALAAPKLPSLPHDRLASRRWRTGKRRAAIIAGAAVAIGLLTTGTVAVGTGIQSSSNHPASTERSSSGIAAPTAAGPGEASLADIAATDPTSSVTRPRADALPTTAPSSAAQAPTVSVVHSEQAPGSPTPAEPAASQPAPPPQPQPSPAPSPAPSPTPQPTPPPQRPAPSVPTGVLNDTLDGVGDAVDSVLHLPGTILGGSGG
ncbi:Hsp70 family protein [Nocardia sp. NPDC049190]|uniref:Hsp70 family protein n=1 Tax=Nocardia sp. NPDC049190 TaxID=3155650 RepID=UPI0033E4D642